MNSSLLGSLSHDSIAAAMWVRFDAYLSWGSDMKVISPQNVVDWIKAEIDKMSLQYN
jgi:predicted DNA-binding transcriptional regulator YafY